MIRKYFVTFMSPGTMCAEKTTKPIKKWHKNKAIAMSKKIEERHGALPYGFYFTCRENNGISLDSTQVAISRMYYLGGEILTLEEVKKKLPEESVLISNMECNGWNRIIINKNSYCWTQPLKGKDEVLII